jgi:hypothetical protein
MPNPQQTTEEKIRCVCVHFTGIGVDACKAGVRYDSFPSDRKIPCIPLKSNPNKPGFCLKKRMPTDEEVKATIQMMQDHDREMRSIFPLIAEMKKRHAGTGGMQVVQCPTCGGKLTMTVASNGHTRGRCSTEGCHCWLE